MSYVSMVSIIDFLSKEYKLLLLLLFEIHYSLYRKRTIIKIIRFSKWYDYKQLCKRTYTDIRARTCTLFKM